MLKQYFTDSLVQIAIILSLLRTDLNTYLNNNYVSYPEVQEIILGQTAGYTLTSFHNTYNLIDSQPVHPKSLENEPFFSSPIFRDFRSLRTLYSDHSVPVNTDVSAFLLTLSSSSLSLTPTDVANNNEITEPPSQQGNETGSGTEVNDSDQQNSNVVALVDGSLEGDRDSNPEAGAISLSNLLYEGSGLTKEDLDLIEVLWRQDIDLGIGKEAFDINLRHELEAERELELKKERQKRTEVELLQLKHEEQCRQQEQQWLKDNFMQDGETGEWIPLSGQDVAHPRPTVPSHPHPQQQLQPQEIYHPHEPLHSHEPLLPREPILQNFMHYGGMNMSPEAPQECESSFQMHQPLNVLSPPHQHQVQPLSNYMPDLETYRNPVPQAVPGSPSVPELTTYNQSVQEMQSFLPPVQEYQRQDSLEQRWMDLVNLLELSGEPESHMSMLMNASLIPNTTEVTSPTQNLMAMHIPNNTSDVLLQNATMPAGPSNINTTMPTFDSAGLLQPRSFNSSAPSDGSASPLEWDSNRLLFPNVTEALSTEEGMEEVDELLPHIISEEILEEISNADEPLADDLQSLNMCVSDDVSSDSAMGSEIGSDSPAHDYDSMSSPSDGQGGAMGGSPAYSGSSKYGSDDYSPSGNAYSPGGSSSQSNYSGSSNDTGYDYTKPNNHNHVSHNHSYPCQPGAQPKEIKKYMKSDRPHRKGPHPRDQNRANELKIPFTVDQIVETQVEEFNELLSRHKLTEPQLQLIRDIRRRGKNKVAAQNCRKRKLDVIVTLGGEMEDLLKSRERLLQERYLIEKQAREMNDKYGQLYNEIFQSLRDEHGQPYDPHLYSLQQSSDGNVFLVPRNITMEEQDSKMTKKHKNEKK
ncbi:hypothetical protein ScPMuIL_013009 [Solemya velum]